MQSKSPQHYSEHHSSYYLVSYYSEHSVNLRSPTLFGQRRILPFNSFNNVFYGQYFITTLQALERLRLVYHSTFRQKKSPISGVLRQALCAPPKRAQQPVFSDDNFLPATGVRGHAVHRGPIPY